jgi:glycopeptide antibiotics resistance protein
MRPPQAAARRLLLLWISVLALVLLPWYSLQSHSHWYKVAWIPFVSPPVRAFDIVANVLLFVPYGWLVRRSTASSRRAWTRGFASAALISLAAELAQVYSHSRFPSATDFTCNLIGTGAGLWWGGKVNHSNSSNYSNSSN